MDYEVPKDGSTAIGSHTCNSRRAAVSAGSLSRS